MEVWLLVKRHRGNSQQVCVLRVCSFRGSWAALQNLRVWGHVDILGERGERERREAWHRRSRLSCIMEWQAHGCFLQAQASHGLVPSPRSWRTCLEIGRTADGVAVPLTQGCAIITADCKHTSSQEADPLPSLSHTPAFPSLLFLTIDQLVRGHLQTGFPHCYCYLPNFLCQRVTFMWQI